MTKLLDSIESERRERTTGMSRRVKPFYEVERPSADLDPAIWVWKFGATVFVKMQGPDEAREHLARQARKILAREVYGEIEVLAIDALHEALEETYRDSNDPLLLKIRAIISMCRGEQRQARAAERGEAKP